MKYVYNIFTFLIQYLLILHLKLRMSQSFNNYVRIACNRY